MKQKKNTFVTQIHLLYKYSFSSLFQMSPVTEIIGRLPTLGVLWLGTSLWPSRPDCSVYRLFRLTEIGNNQLVFHRKPGSLVEVVAANKQNSTKYICLKRSKNIPLYIKYNIFIYKPRVQMFQQLETFFQIIDPNFCYTTYFVKKTNLNHRKCICNTMWTEKLT